MDTNSIITKGESESVVVVNDDVNGPPVIQEFFSKLNINIEKNRWTCCCNICSLSVTDTYKTTSNFLKHIKTKHRFAFDEWKSKHDRVVNEQNQPKITNIFNRENEKYSANNKRQQLLTNSLIRNLIINMSLPLSIVDNESFMNFMLDADPKYKMINRRDITRSFLPIMYKKCIKKLQDICNRSKYVSLTLDIWSDRRMRSYFGITLHTIIDDQYKTYVLSFERLKGKHCGDKLAAEFDRVIQMYNLKDKLVRIVTDNASNNQAAFDNLMLPGFEEYFNDIDDDQSERETSDEDSDDNNKLYENSQLQAEEVNDDIYGTTLSAPAEQEFLRLPCFSHCLQLVVNDGIKAGGGALSSLKKVADLAKLAHTSTSFAERLEEQKYSIPLANRTRWNSQFQTVKKVISIPSFILNSILTDLKKNNLILNTKDRKILEDFVSLFELFNEATVLTQGECYATVSLVAPTILGILFDLEREHASSNLSLVSLCEALLSSLKARFRAVFQIDSCQYNVEEDLWHIQIHGTDQYTDLVAEYMKYQKKKMDESNIILMFGNLLLEMGEYTKAEAYFDTILNSSNPNDEEIACIFFNFGRTHQLKGDFYRAINCYNRAYNLHMNARPKRLTSAGKTLNGLGIVYSEQGRKIKAEECFQQAMKLYKKSISKKHVDVAGTLINLGTIDYDRQHYDEAIVKYRKAKKIYDSSLPSYHPNHAIPRVNLGNVYLASRDYSKACEEYEIALKLQQQSLPNDHPDIARTLHNLALVQKHLGNIEQAKEYLERAEEIADHTLSSKHPVVSLIRKTKALMTEET
ncbi:unnamed protein product [Rotaria sp. Silwood2]|nr:unnamed protein product [Rotaria sp. Silwood2]CAF2818997.1 unnamed protein product [Rotaria sp. Silwood2]CAF3277087.1 unnamed protein product [Rotaria sp. Silwood2]CAF4434910.1 unnamed protein product [Rotaria sp. Silwood2]CAF4481139.1 unnamed protein product [Rotaria sp. Silwood2]